MRVCFDYLRFALFARFALRVRVCVLCVCAVLLLPGALFAADSVADSVETSSNAVSKPSLDEYVPQDKAKLYRIAMANALTENRMEDLRRLVEDAEAYERTVKAHSIFFSNDKLVLNYFLKNFDYLSDVDSVNREQDKVVFDEFHDVLFTRLWVSIESGELESSLNEIDDESDRAFIDIVLNSLFKTKSEISKMIKKNRNHLTKRVQLDYLESRFKIVNVFNKNKFSTMFLGMGLVKPLGTISDTLKTVGIAIHGGMDWMRKNLMYELFVTVDFFDTKGSESLRFSDIGFDFNLGYRFVNRDKFKLYGAGTAGLGMNFIGNLKDENGDKKSSAVQFYPTFGASVIADVFFTDLNDRDFWDKSHSGLRIRAGVSNFWADRVLDASGVKLYASLEWVSYEYNGILGALK